MCTTTSDDIKHNNNATYRVQWNAASIECLYQSFDKRCSCQLWMSDWPLAHASSSSCERRRFEALQAQIESGRIQERFALNSIKIGSFEFPRSDRTIVHNLFLGLYRHYTSVVFNHIYIALWVLAFPSRLLLDAIMNTSYVLELFYSFF